MAYPFKRRKILQDPPHNEQNSGQSGHRQSGIAGADALDQHSRQVPRFLDDLHAARRDARVGNPHYRHLHRRQIATGVAASTSATISEEQSTATTAESSSATDAVQVSSRSLIELPPVWVTATVTLVVPTDPSLPPLATLGIVPPVSDSRVPSFVLPAASDTLSLSVAAPSATSPPPSVGVIGIPSPTSVEITPPSLPSDVAPAASSSPEPSSAASAPSPPAPDATSAAAPSATAAAVPNTTATPTASPENPGIESGSISTSSSTPGSTVDPVTASSGLPSAVNITESASPSPSIPAGVFPTGVIPSNATMTGATLMASSSAGTATLAPQNATLLSSNLTATSTTRSGDMLAVFGILTRTLADGSVTTVTASRTASLTTLADGNVSTIYGDIMTSTLDASASPATSTASVTASASPSASPALPTMTGVGGGTPATSTSNPAATSSSSESNSDMPPPQIIAGGVVGGVAGVAVILLVILFVLRWLRRRSKKQQRLIDSTAPASAPRSGGMAERGGLVGLTAAAGGLLGRRKAAASPAPGETGFQRVSGRKLPSAFSQGMTARPGANLSPPVPMPAAFARRNTHNPSGSDGSNGSGNDRSFYRDSTGYYGGTAAGEESGSAGTSPGEVGPLNLQTGPARTATVHHIDVPEPTENPFADPSPISPPFDTSYDTSHGSENQYRDTLGSSHYSRFTEEV